MNINDHILQIDEKTLWISKRIQIQGKQPKDVTSESKLLSLVRDVKSKEIKE